MVPWVAGGVVLYLVLAVTCAVLSWRRGHYVLFGIGFLLPVFWLIGSVVPPDARHARGR
jgi:hypothetical protein